MITYSIFDDAGNLVEAWDDRAESLAMFVRFISQDSADMAWFAHDADGSIIESVIYDPKPSTPVIIQTAPPARPRARTAEQVRRECIGGSECFCGACGPVVITGPTRGRTLAEAKGDYNRREAIQAEMKRVIEDDLDDWADPVDWEQDHFCGHGEPIDACLTCNILDDVHAY